MLYAHIVCVCVCHAVVLIRPSFMTRRYRWGETNAGMNWKERGRGDMKLQRNGNSRLLMRRPETKKICCNQVIVPDIKIEYYKGQDNFLQWTSLDFSGDEGSDPTRPCVTPSCQRPLRFFALSYLGIVRKHVTSRQRQWVSPLVLSTPVGTLTRVLTCFALQQWQVCVLTQGEGS